MTVQRRSLLFGGFAAAALVLRDDGPLLQRTIRGGALRVPLMLVLVLRPGSPEGLQYVSYVAQGFSPATNGAAQTKSSKDGLTVTGAWLRAGLEKQVTGGYAVLENRGDAPVSLTAVRSQIAKTIELHTISERDGMMRMDRVNRITVPPRGKVALQPGGYHLMLFDLTRSLIAGECVSLTFVTDSGREFEVIFEVRKRDE